MQFIASVEPVEGLNSDALLCMILSIMQQTWDKRRPTETLQVNREGLKVLANVIRQVTVTSCLFAIHSHYH